MKRKLLFVSLFLLTLSCQKEIVVNDEFQKTSEPMVQRTSVEDDDDGAPEGDPIVLGNKLVNPYTLENMQTVTDALLNPNKRVSTRGAGDGGTGEGGSGGGTGDGGGAPDDEGGWTITLEPTYYYVRFLPKSESEMDILSSLNLELFDHPMDYEIVQNGDYYHDPSLPSNNFTWQYTNVPANFNFPPNIQVQILESLFLNNNGEAQAMVARKVEARRELLANNGMARASQETPKIPNWYDMESLAFDLVEQEGARGRALQHGDQKGESLRSILSKESFR